MELIFTAKERFVTCVHEAGHAVIAALGGLHVVGIEVQEVGVDGRTATLESARGVERQCIGLVSLDSERLMFNPRRFSKKSEGGFFLRQGNLLNDEFKGRPSYNLKEIRRETRAQAACNLGGPFAEWIFVGEGDWRYDGSPGVPNEGEECYHYHESDFLSFYETCSFLSMKNEPISIAQQVEKALREPEIWASVMRLAELVYKKGVLEYGETPLPPPRAGWPRSARGFK